MEIAKQYTNTLEILNKCEYIYPDISNAKDALLSCSGKSDKKNPIEERYCLNSNRPIIEGFSMDNNNMLLGPGVGYTQDYACEDGVKRSSDGTCEIQEFSGRKRDGNWQRGWDREIMHAFKDVYDPCKSSKYTISSGGYFVCLDENESGESLKENIIEGFDSGKQQNKPVVVIDEKQAGVYSNI